MSSTSSSATEISLSSSSDSISTDVSSENEGEVIIRGNRPYQDEPLAAVNEEESPVVSDSENETDEDGLTPAVLEARYLRQTDVHTW